MDHCEELQVVPTNVNGASLMLVDMSNCSRLKMFPDISMNIEYLDVSSTDIEEVHPSIVARFPRLDSFKIGRINLKRLTHVPGSIIHLDLSNSCLERIPECVMGLPQLLSLFVDNCRKLLSLQGLPPSLRNIHASNCGSLERICLPCNDHSMELMFPNCFKLDKETRRVNLLQRVDGFVLVPGKKVPAEFIHKATGNSITISLGSLSASWSLRFRACLLLSPVDHPTLKISCRLITEGCVIITEYKWYALNIYHHLTSHLFICGGDLLRETPEVDVMVNEIMFEVSFEFRCMDNHKIIECGVQLLTEETENSSGSEVDYFETGGSSSYYIDGDIDYQSETVETSRCKNVKKSLYTCCWSWLKKLWSGEEDKEDVRR